MDRKGFIFVPILILWATSLTAGLSIGNAINTIDKKQNQQQIVRPITFEQWLKETGGTDEK